MTLETGFLINVDWHWLHLVACAIEQHLSEIENQQFSIIPIPISIIYIHPSEKAIPESNEVINLIGIPMNTYKKATTVEGNGSILEVYWDSDWNEVRINANIPMGNSIINLL